MSSSIAARLWLPAGLTLFAWAFTVPVWADTASRDKAIASEGHTSWRLSAAVEHPSHHFLLAVGEGRGSLEASEKRLQFIPSNAPELNLSVNWNELGFNYRSKLHSETGRLHEVRLGYVHEIFEVTGFYQRFTGFSVDLNASSGFTVTEQSESEPALASVDPVPARQPDIWQRPDVGTTNYGFHSRMRSPLWGGSSSRALIEDPELEWLLITGILAGGYQRLVIEGGEALIPKARQETFGIERDLMAVYQHALGASMGLRMDFITGKAWSPYFEGAAGGEALMQTLEYRDLRKLALTSGRVADFGLGLKYQARAFVAQAYWNAQIRSAEVEGATLDSLLSRLGVELAYEL